MAEKQMARVETGTPPISILALCDLRERLGSDTPVAAALACDVTRDRRAGPPAASGESDMAELLVNVESIDSYFQSLSDPRHPRNRKHLLVDVVVIAVCALTRSRTASGAR